MKLKTITKKSVQINNALMLNFKAAAIGKRWIALHQQKDKIDKKI